MPGIAQNLVQNPSFESLTAWDEFWFLSTTAPSTATAVAIENITDAHEGSKSVELSNTVGLAWTYFYSDTTNAPIVFSANQSYEVKGWIKILEQGKRAELSIFWNNSLDEVSLYRGNPDPVSDPDWFMVEAIITPTADYSDGYLSLGFRADKDGTLGVGRILFDDFSVTRLPSTETDIIDFSIPEQTGPAMVDANLHTVTVEVPYGTDVTALVPTIEVSPWASINPVSGVPVDFTFPFVYTVTAEDGITTQDWTVTVTFAPPSTETEIVSFTLAEQAGPAIINNLLYTVTIEVPYATDVTSLVPTIGLSIGATIAPASGVAADFSAPVVYTVTAQDGTTMQDWTVTVIKLPNTETDIISFTLAEQTGPTIIDNLLHTVVVEVPFGTDVTALAPTISLSAGATINPGSGVARDFSTPVVYTVTAEDGTTTQDWTATVVILPNTETDILAFTVPEQTGPANINNVLHNVIMEVKYGTDVSALAPTIVLSPGATINPASGAPGDFSVPIVYRVTAEDGITSQNYIVAIMVSTISNETDIIGFTLPEQDGPATIDNLLHTVEIEVPYAIDVTSLVPAIGVSAGATIDPASGVTADFSDPVTYTVTAEDGVAVQDWTASVIVLPNTETDIVSFSLPEQSGPATIDNLLHTVGVEVPHATDVTSLVPIIGLSAGATINPGGGIAADFSDPVAYTVTADDGVSVQDWTVTVVLLPNTDTEIVDFFVAEQIAPVSIDSLLHTITAEVPDGTDVTALVPAIELSEGATSDPDSGVSTDFSAPVVYTVIAEDGVTEQNWMIAVVFTLSTEADIISFSLAEATGPATIESLQYTVSIEVSDGTDIAALVPTIGLSDGATVVPVSGVEVDFSAPAVYTVTAEDGATTQDWTVTVIFPPNTDTEINSFTLADQGGPESIDSLLHTVSLEVSSGSDLTALVPTITLSEGATIDPASGASVDLSAPVVFTVTAEDGVTTQDWTVNVIKLPNSETEIVEFSLAEQTGQATIDTLLQIVTIEVVKETDVTAMVPTIGLSTGATIDPVSGSATDFSAPVVYTVTAEDGITSQEWTVSVSVDPAVSIQPEKASITFKVYPNPARDMIQVEISRDGDIYLRDITGRVVTAINNATSKTTIPVSDFERGTYFIQLISSDYSQVFKMVLE